MRLTMNENRPQAPWYIVTVGPAAEKAVAHEFTERKLEVFLPTETIWRTLGRKTKYERPLIRGYVFVATHDLPGLFQLVHDIAGAGRICTTIEGTPAVIPVSWIHESNTAWASGVFDQTALRDKKGKIKHKLEIGDAVILQDRLYHGYPGVILRLKGKKRAEVVVSWIRGQQVTTDVELTKLEAA